MLKLSAFADEISPNLDEQIKVCRANGISHIELRGVNKINVLDFDKDLRNQIKAKLANSKMGVICIGSPIGKVKIDEPWEKHFDRFKIAIELAEFFRAPLVRIFSYYPPEGGDILSHRAEIMRRMRAKVDYIQGKSVTLVHENEGKIFGEKVQQCVDLMTSIDSKQFRSAFDFGNFVHAGEDVLANWQQLKPYTVHIHVKDAIKADGKHVPAGKGDGRIPEILSDAYKNGYRGFLSLEPHLSAGGQFSGFTGADLFKTAVDGLKTVCRERGIPLAG